MIPKIGDIVKLDYDGEYIIYVKVNAINNLSGKLGFTGYLIHYIDNIGNASLQDLLGTTTGNYCAYKTYKILKNIDEIMVDVL